MQTRLLPTKGQGIHREGSIMTARLLYLTDLGGRFKRVGFVESRTRFPNTNTFSKALNFIVHKGNLYSYYLIDNMLLWPWRKSKFNYSLFNTLMWNFAKRGTQSVLHGFSSTSFTAAIFRNRGFQADKGNSLKLRPLQLEFAECTCT